MSELNMLNIYIYKFDKIVCKVAKLLKYRLPTFKDILTFLGRYYRDTSLIILYIIVKEINTQKIRSIKRLYHIKFVVKQGWQHP